ncbi:MAG TPA: hypothetical protein VF756_10830 [Thermoanaerobaculia bacterium]
MKFKFRKWHIRIALAIAALSIGDALYLWSEGEHLSEVLHGAAEMAILLLLGELAVITMLEQDEFLNYAKGAIERNASPVMRFEDFVERSNTHPLLSSLGREAIRDFLRTHKFLDHGFGVAGQHESIKSYVTFWQYLVDQQKKTNRSIVVRVVHSLNIEIWRDEKMRAILDKQSEFIKEGGEVHRLIISAEEPGDSHFAIIKDMVDRNIAVTFVQRKDFDHDFLVASSLDIAVTWTGTVGGQRIQRIEYTFQLSDDDKQAFRDMWEAGNLGAVDATKLLARVT